MKTYNCEIEAPSKQFFVFILNIDYTKEKIDYTKLTKTFHFLFCRVVTVLWRLFQIEPCFKQYENETMGDICASEERVVSL